MRDIKSCYKHNFIFFCAKVSSCAFVNGVAIIYFIKMISFRRVTIMSFIKMINYSRVMIVLFIKLINLSSYNYAMYILKTKLSFKKNQNK